VSRENKIRHDKQEENIAQAAIDGSWQHEVLEEVNASIEQENKEEGRTGRHKRRKRNA